MLEQYKPFLHSAFLLCISIGFLLFHGVASQIPLGSKLSLVENNFWVSSNGVFALGFFNHSDMPNQFSVGIRFNSKSIPVDKQTVVWVAGAEVTVSNESYFQLNLNGELVLYDSLKGAFIWTSNTSQLSVTSAVLRDNGNLVLLNEKEDIVWQSFDTPSDTLLPGQKLSVYKMLRAASKTSVSSYFSLYFNASGQLQLRWESDVIYWTSESPSSSNLSAVLSSDGALQLLDQTSKPVWSVYGEDHKDSVKFRLLRLDADGNLRLYSWVEDLKSWSSVWQAIENQCKVFATCGEQGICVFNASGSPECKCPNKFASESNSKCLVPYKDECKSGMLVYEHTFLYGIYPANDSVFQASLHQCKTLCQDDPDCVAVTFTNDGNAQCRMKTTRYVTGYSDPSSVSFVKSCSDPLAVDPNSSMYSPPSSPLKESYRLCVPCLLGAATGTFVVIVVIQLGIGFYIYRRRISAWKKTALSYRDPNSKGLIMLSFAEIKDVAGNFKHQMGPTMFRGTLPNNQPVTIKKMEATIEERKFRSAVSKIGNIHHKNLVKLEGYCCESGCRYLVYEYARNGSVEKFIEDSKLRKRLTWEKRVEICLSVARAIYYLHTACREFVSHGNLKCENVVLDENFEAKVTEFGLGIIDGGASAEKDVEDFGKMVLILVSGCREVEDVCEWAYKEWIEGQAERVVDKRIDGEVDLEELERALRIAFWCLQTNDYMRPSMGEIVKGLEGTMPVDPPPSPFACRRAPEEDESLESGSEP